METNSSTKNLTTQNGIIEIQDVRKKGFYFNVENRTVSFGQSVFKHIIRPVLSRQ